MSFPLVAHMKKKAMAQLSFIKASKLVELLGTADPSGDMYVGVLTNDQLALGADPLHPTSVIEFSCEAVHPFSPDVAVATAPVHPRPTAKLSRRSGSGKYLVEVKGHMIEGQSLKEVLAETLKAIEAERPGTLEKLSNFKNRTKRIVARDPARLFDRSHHLVENYAEKLMDGWWYGINNSRTETNNWIKRTTEVAGLIWGKDVTTSF